MEPAEHGLLADLRRARRSLRLRSIDKPPADGRPTLGQRIADATASVMGSWTFIIVQSAILLVWITANLVRAIRGWDPYPFILLNLSQNRQQDIDRRSAENDYQVIIKAELETRDGPVVPTPRSREAGRSCGAEVTQRSRARASDSVP